MTSRNYENLSPRQKRVHQALQAVGGYWRPLAAVARVLEELGELSDLLAASTSESRDLADELADLWIITAAIANQFLIDIDDGSASEPTVRQATDHLLELLCNAGALARAINHYDGPKNPRTFDDWISATQSIARLHLSLRKLASHHGIDLDDAVDRKLGEIQARDAGRFTRAYDPSTAATLDSFEAVRGSTHCHFASTAKLWGAPEWDESRSIADNVEAVVPPLLSFTKCANLEGLDGFVVEVAKPFGTTNMQSLARSFARYLRLLVERDQQPNESFTGLVETPGWQFTFNGLRMFVAVFSPLYGSGHVRHSPAGTYLIFQPEASFDLHGIGGASPTSSALKRTIRRRFREAGREYPERLIDDRLECRLYVLPRFDHDRESMWWIDT